MKELSPVQKIAESIAEFYLQKNNGDCEAAKQELQRVWITSIKVVDGGICEACARPTEVVEITAVFVGVLIGKRGSNIEALSKHLGKCIKIKENIDLEYLIPYVNKREEWAGHD